MSDKHVFVIAEAGVNHNGSLDAARRLVDIAADAGADAVKFQTFKAERLVARLAPKAEYQTKTTGGEESQFEMLKKLELSESDHLELVRHAASRGIQFLSTPFDTVSLALLVNGLGMQTVKIPSGEITNAPFLLEIARVAPRVIVSTGMSTLSDVEAALEVLAFGFVSKSGEAPSRAAFRVAFASDAGQEALRQRVTLLHCTTEYPAPIDEVNLRAMDTLHAAFGLPVGYSDHTQGIHVPVAAVARGACLIEKHFTSDRNLPGPDHAASLEPDELIAMVSAIRGIERALGDGLKRPTQSELGNVVVARKSIVAELAIEAGATLSEADLACKRPGTGVSPFDYWTVLGRKASRNYAPDEMIDE
jgi:N-acetylneuraminate synthase